RPAGRLGNGSAVVAHRGKDDLEPRHPGDGANDTDISHRAIHPPVAFIPGAEIDDLDRAAILSLEPGDQHRGVADIFLRGADLPFQLEAPDAAVLVLAVEQR